MQGGCMESGSSEITDLVTDEWLEQHGIRVDRTGKHPEYYQSPNATATIKLSPSNRIIHAHTCDNTILDYLVEKEIIEPFHAEYAKRFLDMKRAFTSRSGATYNRLYYAMQFLNATPGDLESIYFLAVKLLGREYEGMVLYSLSEARTAASQRLAYRQAIKFEEAFCGLVCAIDEARKRVEEDSAKT